MPRKTAAGAGKRKDVPQTIIESALTLAASSGWARASLGDIAEARRSLPRRAARGVLLQERHRRGLLCQCRPRGAGRAGPRDGRAPGHRAPVRRADEALRSTECAQGRGRRDRAERPIEPGRRAVRVAHDAALDALDARSGRFEQCRSARRASRERAVHALSHHAPGLDP